MSDLSDVLKQVDSFPKPEKGLTAELDENGVVLIRRANGTIKMAMSQEDFDALRSWSKDKAS